MDFLNFFGLKEDPFRLTPDPAYFYPSSSHNEGLLLMDYSTEQREGFLLIVGDPGTGKTTLLNVFLEKWKSRAEIAIILTPRLSPEEFLVSVVEDLGINLEDPRLRPPAYDMRGQASGAGKNKNEIIKTLMDFMIKKSSEDRRVIIVVDEAQNLPDDTLEELRLLSNLETDKDKLFQIVMIGQPELEPRLMTDRLRQLNQRITTRIHLKHFRPDETLDYINHRLIKAGKRNLKIHKKAGKLIHKLSNGIPRLINMLISRSLMAAYLEESNVIHPGHINHAVKSLNHSDIKTQKRSRLLPVSAALLLVLLFGVVGYMSLRYINTEYHVAIEKSLRINKPREIIEPISQDRPMQSETRSRYESLPTEQKPSEPIVSEDKEIPTPSFKFISVTVDVANIREMASLTSKKVGQSVRGNRFVVLQESIDDRNTTWYQILYGGGRRWISEEVVDVVDLPDENKRLN
jgi:general secretion pathway protein A